MRRGRTWLGPVWIASSVAGLILAALGLLHPILRIPSLDVEQWFAQFRQGGVTRAWIAYTACLAGFLVGVTGRLRWLGLGLSIGGWTILAIACCRILASLINTALKTGVGQNRIGGSELLVILPGGWCYTGALATLALAFCCEWSLRKRPPESF